MQISLVILQGGAQHTHHDQTANTRLHIPCTSLLTSQPASLHTLPLARATQRYPSMELHRELTTQSSNNLTRSTRDTLQVWISCACLTRGISKLTHDKSPYGD